MAKKIQWGAAKDKWGKYTEDCAADTNRWLQEQGIESYGHAYQVPDQFRKVFNGYPSQLPEFPKDATASDSTRIIMDYHRLASDNIKENFDKSKLNPKSFLCGKYVL